MAFVSYVGDRNEQANVYGSAAAATVIHDGVSFVVFHHDHSTGEAELIAVADFADRADAINEAKRIADGGAPPA